MKRLAAILITMLTAIAFSSVAQCEVENTVFQKGEKLKYKAYYTLKGLWVPAGVVEFEVDETKHKGTPAFKFSAKGKTLLRYDWFFKVRDYYESVVAQEDLRSLTFHRDINEGGYFIKSNTQFDYEQNKIFVQRADYKRELHERQFDMGECTSDMLSMMYKLRNVDYDRFLAGDTMRMQMFLDKRFYNLWYLYDGKQQVETEFGVINCVKVKPLLVKGRIFDDENGMTIYVTDDKNRVPVMVESDLTVGAVKAVLIDFDNLKHPINFAQQP